MPKNELKYPNSFRVSYSKDMYLRMKEYAHKQGISIQDLQRLAVDRHLAALDTAEQAKAKEKPITGTSPFIASCQPQNYQPQARDSAGRTPEQNANIILPRKQNKQ